MRRWKAISAKKKWRAERGALDAREQQEKKDYATVNARARGQCEVILAGRRCPKPKMFGLHHVTKRSQGGKHRGTDALVAVCARHHDLADNAHPEQRTLIDGQWVRGRLMISALGGGRFRCWMETATKTTTHRPGRAGTPTNRLSRETSAAFHAPKAPEQSEAS